MGGCEALQPPPQSWKGKLRHRFQTPGEPAPISLQSHVYSLLIFHLHIFFFFFSLSLITVTEQRPRPLTTIPVSMWPSTTPSLCTITTLQDVGEDLPR